MVLVSWTPCFKSAGRSAGGNLLTTKNLYLVLISSVSTSAIPMK